MVTKTNSFSMIENLRQFNDEITRIIAKYTPTYHFLYRGQTDADWGIKSSLERIGIIQQSCRNYYTNIERYKPAINSIFNKNFTRNIGPSGYKYNFSDYDPASWSLPDMEYLTYLRHHGFPTPLIDWTASPYVALFFACLDFSEKKNGKVFIYRKFQEFGGTDIPQIMSIGPYVQTDKRHYAQQSQYLISYKYNSADKEWIFISFIECQVNNSFCHPPDEIEIDFSAKKSIIKDLHVMNINRYTLFLDEDSLIKNFTDELLLDQILQ